MLFPKPEYRSKKSKRMFNDPIKEYIPCEHCGMNAATETHEWFNGPDRNFAIINKAQSKLCNRCHRYFTDCDKEEWKPYQRKHQRRIMQEKNWNVKEWVKHVRQSYL